MDVPTRTFPAPNATVLAWGSVALAYASNQTVAVVDPRTCQVIQVLEGHQSPVCSLAWRKDYGAEHLSQTGSLRIASGDTSGRIIVWDAASGGMIAECAETEKRSVRVARAVTQLAWLSLADLEYGFLLALHAPAALVLWHAEHGTPVWRVDTDRLSLFALDPFEPGRLALILDNALCLTSFTATSSPSLSSPKYRVLADTEGPSTAEDDSILSLFFSPQDMNVLFLLFRRELLAMDLDINQTILSIKPERAIDRFRTVLACTWSPAMYVLDENSTITCRVRAGGISTLFETSALTDVLRLGRSNNVTLMAVNPLDESQIAAATADGKIFLFQNTTLGRPAPPVPARIAVTAAMQGLGVPLCVRAQPRRGDEPSQLLAVGTTLGVLQLFSLSSGQLLRHISISGFPVRAIEWCGRHSLIAYTAEESLQGLRSRTVRMDVRSGRPAALRELASDAPLLCMRVSKLEQYVFFILKDRPPELWDLRTEVLVKLPITSNACTAVDWSLSSLTGTTPAKEEEASELLTSGDAAQKYVKEHCALAMLDGHIYHYIIDAGVARHGSTIYGDVAVSSVTTIAWKDNILVIGDSAGNLIFWDLKNQVPKHVTTSHGAVRELLFTPGRGNRLLILYADGVDLWDAGVIEALVRRKEAKTAKLNLPSAISWAAADRPVVAHADGLIRVCDLKLLVPAAFAAASDDRVHVRMRAPKPSTALAQLWAMLHDNRVATYVKDNSSAANLAGLQGLLPSLNDEITPILNEKHPATRALLAAKYFGDEFSFRFWSLVAQHLDAHASDFEPTPPHAPPLKANSIMPPRREPSLSGPPPPGCFQALVAPQTLRTIELQRLSLHESRKLTYEQSNSVVERQIMFGQHQHAVRTLLDLAPQSSSFVIDLLRACIVAAVATPETSQQVLHDAALALLERGHVREGTELLFVSGLGQTACLHLQLAGRWTHAARYAKATLPRHEHVPVLLIWADHFAAAGTAGKEEAALIYVSSGQYRKAIEVLSGLDRPVTAALLLNMVVECNLCHIGPDHDDGTVTTTALSSAFATRILALYAAHLQRVGIDLPSSRLHGPAITIEAL